MKWRKRALRGRPEGLEIFNTPWQPHSIPHALDGDLLNLHWIAKWLDYPSFFGSIPDDFPIVWTLHDMNPLTGGCHFSGDCLAFTDQCGHCPQLGRPQENDISRLGFRMKMEALRKKNLHVVGPSNWLTTQAKRSPILERARSFRTIPYGLDVEAFRPQDKTASKRQLGISPETVVVGFGADSFQNRRKGLAYLLSALAQVRTETPFCGLIFGEGSSIAPSQSLPYLHSVGYLSGVDQQALVYSASDIFVLPSLEDNLPQTGLEAMACGTPVVAFAAGGIPDYVRDGHTGLLADVGDAAALARRIERLLDDREARQQMGANARHLIEREYPSQREATAYRSLFETLIAERPVSSAA